MGRALTCLKIVDDAVCLDGEICEARDVEKEHTVSVEVWSISKGHQFLLRLIVLRLISDGAQVLVMVKVIVKMMVRGILARVQLSISISDP